MSGVLNLLLAGAASAIKDAYFNLTTLLLNTSSTNGAQNNTFLDSSTNNFTITRNGNTTQGTFTPFSQTGWSNYFNGSSSYITATSNAAYQFGTGDFTIECWLYTSAFGSSPKIFQYADDGNFSSGGYGLEMTTISTIQFGTSAATYTLTSSAPVNQWFHFALVRSSGTLTAYINGSSVFSTANSYNFNYAGTYPFAIGSGRNGAGNYTYAYTGYISNFRVVKGTAVYTSAFTPPTTPLTAISGTSLLTCQSNRFLDNSTNAFAITANGTPSVQAFSPFAPTAAYDPAVVGGSGYFDGTGDCLTLANNAALQMSASDFTLEAWVYTESTANQVFMAHEASGALGFQFAVETNQSVAIAISSSGSAYATVVASTSKLKLGQWNHVAAVRSGSGTGNITIYINGVKDATTGTFAGTMNAPSTTFQVGCRYASGVTAPLIGYLGGCRVIKGQALYTASTITIPDAPFTTTGYGTTSQSITGAVNLLINFTNAGIYDSASKNVLETVGNAQVSTTQAKWGTTSMAFDGTGDYLITNSQVTPIGFGSGDWTIEFWLYLNSTGTQVIFDGRRTAASDVAPMIYYLSGLKYYTAGNDRITGGTLSTGQWYHIAVCRSGTSTKMFIDGTQTGSTYTDTNSYVQQSQRPTIGAEGVTIGNSPLNAYIDDLRISKYARYTTTFTAPTAALPTQ